MHEFIITITKILQIMVLNIILSFDSISVIAILSNDLPLKYIKKAYTTGISIAIIFTIFFTSIISLIMEIQWLPIQLFGGLLLIKITVDLLKSGEMISEKSKPLGQINKEVSLFSVIIKIVLISLSLSFDNIVAIAGAADGNIDIITCGLLLSLPIILFTCKYLFKIIYKVKMILYFCGAILIYTAFEMIFSYHMIAPYIPKLITRIIPLLFSVSVIVYGLYIIKVHPEVSMVCKSKDK